MDAGNGAYHSPQSPWIVHKLVRRTTALTKCLQLDVCAPTDERNAAASAAAVARAAATAAVAPAIGALCISYTGPGLVQALSDFEECLHKHNWLSSQPDFSPVGDSEDAWEGLQQARGIISN